MAGTASLYRGFGISGFGDFIHENIMFYGLAGSHLHIGRDESQDFAPLPEDISEIIGQFVVRTRPSSII
jgi:hypothetical protein